MTKRAHSPGGVIEQGTLESRIGPSLGNHLCAVMGTNFCLVGLDNGVERCRIDIAFFGQDGLERTDTQLGLGQFRMVVIVLMMVVIMVSHGAKHSRNILSMSRRRNCYHL